MNYKPLLLLLLMSFLGCKDSKVKNLNEFSANNNSFSYSGRTIKHQNSVGLIGSASSVEFNVEGDSIVLLVKLKQEPRNYISISVNDEYVGRYLVLPDSINKIGLNLPESKTNKIGVFKATEAFNGEVLFYGVEAENISPINDGSKFTIEFIGDSITCGALSDDSQIPCGEGEYLDQHNAYLSYGPRIAKDLNANFFLSSVSGIGMYRNWNDENIEEPIMPQVYENLYLNQDSTHLYNFEVKPDLVSICLGTNDMSEGDGVKERLPFNPEKYTKNYIDFVQKIYGHYPDTIIVLLNSPMIQGEKNEILIECLEEVQAYFKQKGKDISIFKFNEIYANGCSYHPSVEDNKKMADYLLPFYKESLNIDTHDKL